MNTTPHSHFQRAALCLSTILACLSTGGQAFAATEPLSFWNIQSWYDSSGSDELYIGMMLWVDGNEYVGAYDARDPNNCKAYFAVRKGQLMIDGLTGTSEVRVGNGDDHVEVVGIQMSPYEVGGPNGFACRNLPRLGELAYNGYTMYMYGEGDHDVIVGGDSRELLSGGGGNDEVMAGYVDWSSIYGDAGRDLLWGAPDSSFLYGGTGRDLLWSRGGSIDYHSAGGGKDCVLDTSGAGYIDCGDDDDSYHYAGASIARKLFWCENKVSWQTCANWL